MPSCVAIWEPERCSSRGPSQRFPPESPADQTRIPSPQPCRERLRRGDRCASAGPPRYAAAFRLIGSREWWPPRFAQLRRPMIHPLTKAGRKGKRWHLPVELHRRRKGSEQVAPPVQHQAPIAQTPKRKIVSTAGDAVKLDSRTLL